jgi:acetolactate synthase-1/2/3 large subunit
MNAAITGGELVIRTLRRAGVETAFGINGAHVDSIYQAALDDGFRIVDTRHEMNAGHAAEGYARVRGGLGVAIVTAGGGFTNVVTSIANAHQDRTPVLYIAGSGPLALDQTNDLQAGIDQVAIATPITKWAHRITRPDLITRVLAQAIRIATTGPQGPVLIDIPWDVLRDSVDETTDFRIAADASGTAPASVIDEILEMIEYSERPVVIVGDRMTEEAVTGDLARFAEILDLPLFSDYQGLGAILRSDHAVGLLQTLTTLGEAERPDLVLMLGVRFGLYTAHGSGAIIPRSARIIQVDTDGRELGRLQDVELGLAADPAATVRSLADAAGVRDHNSSRSNWRHRLRALAEERFLAVGTEASANPSHHIHPFEAVDTIASSVPEGTIVVSDGALTYLWLSEAIARAPISAYLGHGYLGSMGIGMGTALGAQVAGAGLPVVLVTGDGAVGYSLGEFDSMARAGLPVVVIVLNNRAWGATLHAQEIVLGPERIVNNRLENGSYSAVARALGAEGYDVTDIEDLAPTIARALNTGRPACIDVRVNLDPIPPEERVLMGGLPFGDASSHQ